MELPKLLKTSAWNRVCHGYTIFCRNIILQIKFSSQRMT